MKKRLAGTRSWDPTGESFWGVLAKLCARNHMSWDEGRSVLGDRLDRSVLSEAGRNPDETTNMCIDRTCELTGWSYEQVRSGFSEFYQPYWMRDRPRADVPLSSSIRLCHECAMAGIHLTVHQFQDWTHCPVHNRRLRGSCPKCGEELGHFQLTGDFPQRSLCFHCHWALWDNCREPESDQGDTRRQFVTDYLLWQRKIESYFCGDTLRYEWLGQPKRYGHLAHVNALVPGPAYVPQCLVNAQKMATRCLGYPFYDYLTVDQLRGPDAAIQSSLDFGDGSDASSSSRFTYTYLHLLRSRINTKYRQLRKRHSNHTYHSGVRELSSKHLTIQHGHYTNCWASAHWLWRRCFDDAWPRPEKWSRLGQPTSILSTELGRQWRRAFSHYFSAHSPVLQNTNLQIAHEALAMRWLDAWLESAYYGFAALSCHVNDLQALNSDDLAVHLSELDLLPLFALTHVDKDPSLISLSPMENDQYFVDMQTDGFEGNNQNMLVDFDKLRPLLEGVGLHPDTMRRWRNDSVRIRTSLDRLRKR